MLAVQRVAAIVAGTVGHLADGGLVEAELIQDDAGDLAVGALVAATDVVDLAGFSLLQHEVDGVGVVVDVQPVAHVQAIAVEGQLLAFEGVGHEEGYELLRILVGAVGVRASGDDDRSP